MVYFQESRLQRPTDYNYLTVTCILIENEHQYAMVDKLTEKFTKMEDHGPLPVKFNYLNSII